MRESARSLPAAAAAAAVGTDGGVLSTSCRIFDVIDGQGGGAGGGPEGGNGVEEERERERTRERTGRASARTRKPDTIMIIINFTGIYYWLSFIFIQYYRLPVVRICPPAIEQQQQRERGEGGGDARERDEVVRDTGVRGRGVYKSRKQRRYAILKYKVD